MLRGSAGITAKMFVPIVAAGRRVVGQCVHIKRICEKCCFFFSIVARANFCGKVSFDGIPLKSKHVMCIRCYCTKL